MNSQIRPSGGRGWRDSRLRKRLKVLSRVDAAFPPLNNQQHFTWHLGEPGKKRSWNGRPAWVPRRPCSHHVRACIIHSCQCKLALQYSECAAACPVIRCRFAGAPLSLCLLFSHSSTSAPIYWSITIAIRARTGRWTRFITDIAIADLAQTI